VTLDEKRYEHILEHAEMKDQIERIKETLKEPEEIRKSIYDESVWLFYRFYPKSPVTKKYMLVIVKVLNTKGFIITAFYTDKIKKGELLWKS
jgi:hypothetical protein